MSREETLDMALSECVSSCVLQTAQGYEYMFLGCNHKEGVAKSPITGKMVRTLTYDMSDFMESCVERYCELAHINPNSFKLSL